LRAQPFTVQTSLGSWHPVWLAAKVQPATQLPSTQYPLGPWSSTSVQNPAVQYRQPRFGSQPPLPPTPAHGKPPKLQEPLLDVLELLALTLVLWQAPLVDEADDVPVEELDDDDVPVDAVDDAVVVAVDDVVFAPPVIDDVVVAPPSEP
jgi:hypothetical protein